MFATQDLRNEHEGIKVALAVLDHFATQIEAGKEVNLDDVGQLLDFLQTFADKCHHGKEEDLLFPALEKAGVPKEQGPIGTMLDEHDHGRAHISAMGRALTALREHDPRAGTAFAKAAHGYVHVLTDHIQKENDVLFVLAEQRLLPEEHEALSRGFQEIEAKRIGPGVHERYHALLDRLSHEYLKEPD